MEDETKKPGRKPGTGKYNRSLTFSVDEKDFDEINGLADSRNKPASELLRAALAQYLKRERKSAK